MAKGIKTGGGSRKGRPNAATASIKEMIEGALFDAGGRSYLLRQAEENPSAFMQLVGKILPKDVNLGGQSGNPIETTVAIKPHPELTPEQWVATFGPK